MTIRKRLFWSNILMILVPAGVTLLIGLCCTGLIFFLLTHGTSLRIRNTEDFDRVSLVTAEIVEKHLDAGLAPSELEPLLQSSGMALQVYRGDTLLYSYGDADGKDPVLLSAARGLGGDATVSSGTRQLFLKEESVRGEPYTTCLFGTTGARDIRPLKTALAVCCLVILLAIVLSIRVTNRFLTRFVFRRIEEPLDILTQGVHQLRDGNLDFRILYDRADEFRPVCQDFNEMAGRLKANVQQLQNEEQSRKTLIAGISHDIRSPLTSIQAYVEGLLDGVARTPEAQRKYLTTIKTKAEDLEHIVSQLFLYAKMELGEGADRLAPLRLDRFLRDTLEELKPEYAQRGLDIQYDLVPAEIPGDPVQLRRTVTNLADNSLKYKTSPRCRMDIRLFREEDNLILSFADDGPGVPEEALPHLFEVFYRGDPARQNPGSGSGLGLAIVAGTAKNLGAEIAAQKGPLGGLEIRMIWRESDGKDTDRGR